MTSKESERRPVVIEVRRQPGPRGAQSWDSFVLEPRERMTVADALDAITAEPYNAVDEQWVAPVVWAGRCSPAGCGPCTLLVNAVVRPACTTMVADVVKKGRPVRLEPLRKLPLVRDLLVDRSRLGRAIMALGAWVDAPPPEGKDKECSQPKIDNDIQRQRLSFARCSHCLACLEACPQTAAEGRGFVGAAAIALSHLADLHPGAAHGNTARLEALMQPGGIADCSHALNCIEVCPEQLPLDDALNSSASKTTRAFWQGLMRR